jgi:hypothetical protein
MDMMGQGTLIESFGENFQDKQVALMIKSKEKI